MLLYSDVLSFPLAITFSAPIPNHSCSPYFLFPNQIQALAQNLSSYSRFKASGAVYPPEPKQPRCATAPADNQKHPQSLWGPFVLAWPFCMWVCSDKTDACLKYKSRLSRCTQERKKLVPCQLRRKSNICTILICTIPQRYIFASPSCSSSSYFSSSHPASPP